MHVIRARNVNDAFLQGVNYLQKHGLKSESRNGEVTVSSEPVTTVYDRPRERVLFLPERDANPIFHALEAMWMLAGRNDIGFLANYASNMINYSDDGVTQWGAYGHRWRRWFGYDQLDRIAMQLTKNPKDRRAVLAIHDGAKDIQYGSNGGLDQPCNLVIHFDATHGELNMSVFCRSNDVIFGVYGANAVHMSFLQEYMAARTNIPMGRYWQISDNYHMYIEKLYGPMYNRVAERVAQADKNVNSFMLWFDPYWMSIGETSDTYTYEPSVTYMPLFDEGYYESFENDLRKVLEFGSTQRLALRNRFLVAVINPMMMAHHLYKQDKLDEAISMAGEIEAGDWRLATVKWLERRLEARRLKNGK